MDGSQIKPGNYVIIQRQGYTKLHKIKERGRVHVGNFLVELDNALSERYETTFQMKLTAGTKNLYTLEKVAQVSTVSQLSIESSGKDNRNITDDGTSQTLTKDEITKLRDESLSSSDIVGKLINSSKSFSSKTEYSQEKYMKKKEKKYFEYIQLRKPSLRLLVQMYYRQDPGKTLGIRVDDLSQILTYGNVQSDGNFLLYDSGTSGLMTAALLNCIGASTTGTLIHMHPGNECQKNAVLALQLPQEQLDRCINVNLYSVLRCYYQDKDSYSAKAMKSERVDELQKEIANDVSKSNENEVSQECRVPEMTNNTSEEGSEPKPLDNETSIYDQKDKRLSRKRKLGEDSEESTPKKPCWQRDNEKACKILESNVDGLIVTSKEHPVKIVKALVPFLKGSRSLVVFSLLKEPLQDLYVDLKSRSDFISLRLTNNFMRNYQVLPERTHPEVNMTNGGFILTGYKLSC